MRILTLFLFCCLTSTAQYNYEPTSEQPFGLLNPEAPQQVKDFEPMIGECDCISTSRKADGSWNEEENMLWRFKYIMNGTAIQDETLKEDGSHSGSIRQFIADSSKWYVHWYSTKTPSTTLPTWEGNKTEDGKIVLYKEQKAPNGYDGYFRLTFYNMSELGYKWIGEWVSKDETIVYPTWKIECTKRK